MSSDITVRALTTVQEFREAVAVQQDVWGFTEPDVIPLHLLLTAARNGGLVLGAYEGEIMIGILFGFVGLTTDGRTKHCSHITGVTSSARGRGVGAALKWAQRDAVLKQGLDLITWTFDPLEARNASLNLHHLGATSSTYFTNVYGDLNDKMNAGLATDRLLVDWRLMSPRVEECHQAARESFRSSSHVDDLRLPQITRTTAAASGVRNPIDWDVPSAPRVLLEIPFSFQEIKRNDMELARSWRSFVRDVMTEAFSSDFTAVDFLTDAREKRGFYVLAAQ